MKVFNIIFISNFLLDILLILEMIFLSKRKPERIIAWSVVMLILPFIGTLIYLLIGAGLNTFSRSKMKKFEISSKFYDENIKKQIKTLKKNKDDIYPEEYKDLILLNLNNADSIYSTNNKVECFLDGKGIFESLKNDIENAKNNIHLEYYIFANDNTGKELINLLVKKASEGVKVRILYDAIGSFKTSKFSFRKLKKVGGKFKEFFPPFLNIKLLNFNANYRNHRKICVIDGKIGYTGGFNIRNDHLGYVKKLSPWRDTTIRIEGGAVHSLQNIFLSDWRFSTKDTSKVETYTNEKFFPSIKVDGENLVPMQVVASGPTKMNEQIKTCMIKMILSAKKNIKIQSPYFIPDDSFVGALKLALLSGVKVELMFPKKIDHYPVHYASFSYINQLLAYGMKVYLYNGFLHSKVLMIDDEIITLGSCNIDIRSFSLNFENNVVLYSKNFAKEYSNVFECDRERCEIYDESAWKKTNFFVKMFINFCRLFSSIL